jgi:hypothetical protein
MGDATGGTGTASMAAPAAYASGKQTTGAKISSASRRSGSTPRLRAATWTRLERDGWGFKARGWARCAEGQARKTKKRGN